MPDVAHPLQRLAQLVAGRSDAREVRHRLDPDLLAEAHDEVGGARARRAARAEGDRHERRVERAQGPHRLEQLLHAGVVSRREELEREGRAGGRDQLADIHAEQVSARLGGASRSGPAYSADGHRRPRDRQPRDASRHRASCIATRRSPSAAAGSWRPARARRCCGRPLPQPTPTFFDARGMSAIPGLVDCHTHSVWAGSRVDEFDRRAQGQSYEQIAAAGGGISATVAPSARASEAELAAAATRRLVRMRALGTTTAEVKSGYGLDPVSEAAMLRAAHAAGAAAGVRVTGTCLGAARAAAGGRLGRGVHRASRSTRSCRPARASRPRPTASWSAARSRPTSAGRSSPRRATAVWRCASTATSSRSAARSRSPPSWAPRRSTTSSRPGPRASGCWPRRASPPCACRCARSTSTCRCRPPARSPTPARGSCSRPTSTPARRRRSRCSRR